MKYETRQKILSALHTARMQPYLNAANQNQRDALSLYRWHSDLTAAVQAVLGTTEVILRNAMDKQLQAWNNTESGGVASWLLNNPEAPLRSLSAGKRNDAKKRAETEATARESGHPRHGQPVTHDDVLAQVMFGMWKDLLPNHMPGAEPTKTENLNRVRLWEESLCNAFPHITDPDGEQIYWLVANLHRLRNRVSHMEPLLNIDVVKETNQAFDLLRAIDPVVADWVTGGSRVSEIVKRRP